MFTLYWCMVHCTERSTQDTLDKKTGRVITALELPYPAILSSPVVKLTLCT